MLRSSMFHFQWRFILRFIVDWQSNISKIFLWDEMDLEKNINLKNFLVFNLHYYVYDCQYECLHECRARMNKKTKVERKGRKTFSCFAFAVFQLISNKFYLPRRAEKRKSFVFMRFMHERRIKELNFKILDFNFAMRWMSCQFKYLNILFSTNEPRKKLSIFVSRRARKLIF